MRQPVCQCGVRADGRTEKGLTTVGGTPHLDGQYTVFGEVIEGLEIVDKIAAVKTSEWDRPVEDVMIKRVRVAK